MVKVVLGVPTLNYEKKMVDSLLSVIDARIFHGWFIPDATLLPQARNLIVAESYKNVPDFTHIMFIDDDMHPFGPQHIHKLLVDDVDVVSALVTHRNPPYKIVASFNEQDDVLKFMKNGAVVETKILGLAFTLIKREVLDAIREQTDTGPIWFNMDRRPRNSFDDESKVFVKETLDTREYNRGTLERAIEFGQLSHIGSVLPGEDITFSWRVKQAGFKVWVDCGVAVGHLGKVSFDFRHALMEAKQRETA